MNGDCGSDAPSRSRLAGTLADLGATLASEAPPALDPGLAATGLSSLPPPGLPAADVLEHRTG